MGLKTKYRALAISLMAAGLLSACHSAGNGTTGGGNNVTATAIEVKNQSANLFTQETNLTGSLSIESSDSQWYLNKATITIKNTGTTPIDLSKSAISFNSQDSKGVAIDVGTLTNWYVSPHSTSYSLAFSAGNATAQVGKITTGNGSAPIINPGEEITFTGGFNLKGNVYDAKTAQSSFSLDGSAPAPAPDPEPAPGPGPGPAPEPTPVPSDKCNGIAQWDSSKVYTGGQNVQLDGIEYTAKWWTQSNNPATSGTDGPWKKVQECGEQPAPVPAIGELDVIVDTTNTACKTTSACHGLAVHVSDAAGKEVSSFVVPDAALGGVFTQPIKGLQANVAYSVATDSIQDTVLAYDPTTAKATVIKDATVKVSAKYTKIAPAIATGKMTISVPTVLASYTGDMKVEILNTVANAVVATYMVKQGASFTTENLPVSDAEHQYSVKLSQGLADPKAGKYFIENGNPIVTITKDQTATLSLPLIQTTKPLNTVTVNLSGLDGSDLANVTFEDASHTFAYVNDAGAKTGTLTYLVESGLDFAISLNATTSNYEQNKLDFIATINQNTTYTAVFKKKETPPAPIANKINATYWSLWGNNTSYDLSGGSYPSVEVDAPSIDMSYNLIIASFIVTDHQGNYVLATSDPGAQTPQQPHYSDEQIINMVNKVKAQKRKVIISLGGQYFHLQMKTEQDKINFVTQVDKIIDKYGFDGIDLDLEGGATSADTNLLAKGVREVVDHYRAKNPEFLLTMAPEWLYIAPARYGCGQWGSGSYANSFYIDLVKSIGMEHISYIFPQTYNQGPGNGVCGNAENKIAPTDGMDKFVSAMAWGITTESGYQVNTNGVTGTLMPMIPQSKFVIGIPATLGAAGGGMAYVMTPAQISSSWSIMKNTYGISVGGFMNWAADWDATPYSNASYNFSHSTWETGKAVRAAIGN